MPVLATPVNSEPDRQLEERGTAGRSCDRAEHAFRVCLCRKYKPNAENALPLPTVPVHRGNNYVQHKLPKGRFL
jgi:hypothetical protein